MARFLVVIIAFAVSYPSFASQSAALQVNWMSMTEMQEMMKKEKRKVIIDVYTDWCGWCKKMDANTFTNEQVVKIINESYYAVRLNAEQKEDIIFKDKAYHYAMVGKRGYNNLANMLLGNQMSFPSIVFLDETLTVIQSLPGYREPEDLSMILSYFATNAHKTTPWSKWEKQFHPVDVAPEGNEDKAAPATASEVNSRPKATLNAPPRSNYNAPVGKQQNNNVAAPPTAKSLPADRNANSPAAKSAKIAPPPAAQKPSTAPRTSTPAKPATTPGAPKGRG